MGINAITAAQKLLPKGHEATKVCVRSRTAAPVKIGGLCRDRSLGRWFASATRQILGRPFDAVLGSAHPNSMMVRSGFRLGLGHESTRFGKCPA